MFVLQDKGTGHSQGHVTYLENMSVLQDLAEALSFPGFWKLGLKHWRFALGEMYRCVPYVFYPCPICVRAFGS